MIRMQDVADHLRRHLPEETERFHDVVSVASVVASSTSATVVTSADHSLQSGRLVALVGVESRTPIASVSKSGLLTTFVTSADHDLTENNPSSATVPLAGFTDDAWNAFHELVNVANRRTFTVRNLLAEPTLNGNELLLEPDRIDGINGLYPVTVANKTTFTIAGSFIAGTYTPVNGKVISNPRVFVSPTVEQAHQWFEDDPESFWCFVIPADAVVSKDRSSQSDAVATIADGDTLRLTMIDEFSVMVFAPTSEDLAGGLAVDICRHELLGPILRSLYGLKFGTGLTCGEADYRLIMIGHGITDYRKAYMVHEYMFQAPADLTDADAASDAPSRAFRDIDMSILGAHTPLTAQPNLDEEPL